MLLSGVCKKCGGNVALDVGSTTDKEEIKKRLLAMSAFHCPGHHVEITSPYPAYWDIDDWKFEEGAAPSEEEFISDLRKEHIEVIDTAEMAERNIIIGFAYGFPMTNDGNSWTFAHSPKGKRWYYR